MTALATPAPTSAARHDPPSRGWSPATVALAGAALVVATAAATLVATVPALGVRAIALLLGLVGMAAFSLLALHRFEDFLVVLFVVRTSLDYFKPSEGGGLLEPPAVVGAAAVAFGLAWLWWRQRNGLLVPTSRLTLALLAMCAVVFVNPLFAVGKAEALQSAIRFASFATLFMVLEQLFRSDPSTRKRLLRAVLWSFPIPMVLAFLQLSRDEGPAEFVEVGRVRGTFFHPNPFGTYLAMIVVIALVLAYDSRTRMRPFLFGTAGLAAVVLLFTYSRGAWVAAIIGVFVVGARLDRRMIYGLLLAGIIGLVAVPSVATRLADLGGGHEGVAGEDRNSLAWRVGYWEDIFPLGLESPIGGIGLESTALVRTENLAPHNVFVQAFVELGVPGLLALLLVLVAAVNEVHRSAYWANDRWERSIAAGAAGIGIGFFLQLFSENLLTQAVSLWYLAVVLAAATANGWVDGSSPTSIRGELSVRQRVSMFLAERRWPSQIDIDRLQGVDLASRVTEILARDAARNDGADGQTGSGDSSGA